MCLRFNLVRHRIYAELKTCYNRFYHNFLSFLYIYKSNFKKKTDFVKNVTTCKIKTDIGDVG